MGRASKQADSTATQTVWRECPARTNGQRTDSRAGGRACRLEPPHRSENRGRSNQHPRDDPTANSAGLELPLEQDPREKRLTLYVCAGARPLSLCGNKHALGGDDRLALLLIAHFVKVSAVGQRPDVKSAGLGWPEFPQTPDPCAFAETPVINVLGIGNAEISLRP